MKLSNSYNVQFGDIRISGTISTEYTLTEYTQVSKDILDILHAGIDAVRNAEYKGESGTKALHKMNAEQNFDALLKIASETLSKCKQTFKR